MRRLIEGSVLALLALGTVGGCHRSDDAVHRRDVGVVSPLGPNTSMPPTDPSNAKSGTRPSIPGIDEVVDGRYSLASGAGIEFIGACHVTEDAVSCWNPQGDRDTALEERMAATLASKNKPVAPRVSFALGMKNRVVIFRSLIPTGVGPSFLNLSSVGPAPNVGTFSGPMGAGAFMLDQPRNATGNAPMERVEGWCVSVDPKTTMTSAFVTATDTKDFPAGLALKVGSTFSAGDNSLTIVSITRSKQPMSAMSASSMPAGPSLPTWDIAMKVGKPTSKVRLEPSPAVFGEQLYTDGKGRILTAKEYSKAMADKSRATGGRPPGSQPLPPSQPMRPRNQPRFDPFTPVLMASTLTTPNSVTYTLNVDPKVLKAVYVRVTRTVSVEISGIRLDPR